MKRFLKLAVKVLLIAAVAGGITLLIVKFVGGLGRADERRVEVTAFERHVEARVADEIQEMDYHEATAAFEDILGEIMTERTVIMSDGRPSIDDAEKERCLKRAFYAYAPILVAYSGRYFEQSQWNEGELKQLRANARRLIDMHIAERGTQAEQSLLLSVNTVNAYYDARQLVINARHCTSMADVEKVINKANAYMRTEPLNNNLALMNDLAQASLDAKSSYATYIVNFCRQIADNCLFYVDYNSFYADYSKAVNMLTEYVERIGVDDRFPTAAQELNMAIEAARDHFNS